MKLSYIELKTKFLNKELNPAIFAKLPTEIKHKLVLLKIRNSKNGDKYKYKMETFKGFKEKITIICPIHGEFEQRLSSHIDGRGCSKCGGSNRKTTSEFIHDAKSVHGDTYDYSKVNYINNITKIEIICPIHGSFWQTPSGHLTGGCRECSLLGDADNFVKRSTNIHSGKYDYSKMNYKNNITKIEIICPIHGSFWQMPTHHVRGCGCQKCTESNGEKRIREWLDKNKISYFQEYNFNKDKALLSGRFSYLRFDFYLPDYNICIEYDGEHHFEDTHVSKVNEVKTRDNIKNGYCSNNKIQLKRIPYHCYNEIEEIMEELIQCKMKLAK